MMQRATNFLFGKIGPRSLPSILVFTLCVAWSPSGLAKNVSPTPLELSALSLNKTSISSQILNKRLNDNYIIPPWIRSDERRHCEKCALGNTTTSTNITPSNYHVTDQNGWVFAPLYLMHRGPGPQFNASRKHPTLRLRFPRLVSPQGPNATAFDLGIRDFSVSVWRQAGGPPLDNPKADKTLNVEVDYRVVNNPLPGIVSVAVTWTHVAQSAAHGESGTYGFNWIFAKRRPVRISDVFQPDSSWSKLYMQVAREVPSPFRSQHLRVPDESIVDNPSRWLLNRKGLTVVTDVYEVGPYADGAPSFFAPWSALKPVLKPGSEFAKLADK